MKVFERKVDTALLGKSSRKKGELVRRILSGEVVTIGKDVFYYEERDVKTGAIKNKQY